MLAAQKKGDLAPEFVSLCFTSPRTIYELYDLDADPNGLHNLYGRKELAAVEGELKHALQRKMIVDFDCLPLPIPSPSRSTKPRTGSSVSTRRGD